MTAPPAWTPDLDTQLAHLWADPTLSATAIGVRMGKTKSAVTGRIWRLGLPQRGSPLGKNAVASKVGKLKPNTRKPMAAAVAPVAPEPATVFLSPTRGGCQWIEGSGPPWRFCDAPAVGKSSWCATHHARCFVRYASPRRATAPSQQEGT
jgi:hypothetical protein